MTVSPTGSAMIGAMHRLLAGFLFAVAAALPPKHAAADPQPAHPVVAVPPSGRVGRLAVVSGKVELRPAGATGWSDAEVNDPVAADSAVRTDPRARAVVEIGADSVALAEYSQLAIAALDAQSMAIDLAQGRVGLALRRSGTADVVVDLPQGEVWLQEPGGYAIDAGSAEGRPRVAVFEGSARVYAAGAEIGLMPGELIELSSGAPISATIAPTEADAFAAWWRAHTIDAVRLTPPFFVSPDITGFAALAGAGHWLRTGGYGEVWLPNGQPADWVPYRDGHWRWIPPWGWNWVADEPWGFAPSHYGRWALLGQGGGQSSGQSWAWVPGDLAMSPTYIPAAVAFIGTPGIGVSYAGGSGPAIGWFPLAPGEAYWPSYTQDLDFIRAVNRGDMVDLASIRPQPDGRLPIEIVDRPFANRLAASVVPRPVFVGGRPVMPALLSLPRERLQDVPVVMGSPRIGPPTSSAPPVVSTARISPPAPRGVAAEVKRAVWVTAVHLAAIRSRLYLQAARLRRLVVLRLRVADFAEPERMRRLVALRLVHHQASHKKEASR
jgi:hypothetical protein